MSRPSADLRRVGPYYLCYEVASGGMATVYLARTEGPGGVDRLVALKCIHRHLSKEQAFVDMFLDEARIASRITHPNVCSVYDFGEADGVYYIAMEYLLGETAARVCRRLSQRPDMAGSPAVPFHVARVMADACEGLHAAHELNDEQGQPLKVVHRDVSPQNVFLNYDGSVRIVDFGIARAVGRLTHTRTGQLKGKLAYVSPEQLNKQGLDRRADVWGLGVVMWEMLTGRRLFKRESEIDTILAVAQDAIEPPSRIRRDVHPGLDRIVMNALERDVGRRYPTARHMGRDIHRFLVQSGTAVGLPETAEWMEALFAEDHARRLKIVSQARTMPAEDLPEVVTERWDESMSGTTVPGAGRLTSGWQALKEPSSKALFFGFGGAAAVLVLAVGLAVIMMTTDDDRPMRAAIPPAQVEAAPVGGEPESGTAPEAEPDLEFTTSEVAALENSEKELPDEGSGAEVAEPKAQVKKAPDRRVRRRRPPRGRQAAVTGTGKVMIITRGGWADVYRGGRKVGRTPTQIELPAGRQTLVLHPMGKAQNAIRRVVRVTDGQVANLIVPL